MRVDRDRIADAEIAYLVLDGARPDHESATGAAPVAENEVLGDAEPIDQPELLVHHADAGVERIPRRREADRLAVELDLPFVGAVETGEDVHQRRLSSAVFSEQGVHLAWGRLEVDMVVGEHAWKVLRDSAHHQRRRSADLAGGPRHSDRFSRDLKRRCHLHLDSARMVERTMAAAVVRYIRALA